MSTIELFNFENSELRFVEKDNTFEIVVQDLVNIFEYSESRRVLDLVEEDYQGMAFFDTPSGKQELRTIKEPGLYQFLARSNKPKCKPFQKWLYEVVLPKIRKEGGYILPTATENQLDRLQETITTLLVNQQKQLDVLAIEQKKLFKSGETNPGCYSVVVAGMDNEYEDEGYVTVDEWLRAKGVTLDTTQLNTIRKRAASFLRIGKSVEPTKMGNRVVYSPSQYCYLEQALVSTLGLTI